MDCPGIESKYPKASFFILVVQLRKNRVFKNRLLRVCVFQLVPHFLCGAPYHPKAIVNRDSATQARSRRRTGETMNKPGRIPSLLLAAMTAAPAAVLADPGQFYLTPFVGWQQFDKSRRIQDSVTWGLGGEYQISEHWGVELDYSQASSANLKDSSRNAKVQRLNLDGIFYFGRHGWDRVFEPYLKAGVGHNRYSYPSGFLSNEDNEFSDYRNKGRKNGTDLDLGAGIRFHFNDHWSARLEAKAIYETLTYETHGLYTLGVSYAFGSPAKRHKPLPPPAAVETPPPPPPAPMVLTKTENMRLAITFDFNKAVIKEEYMGEVERAATFLKKYPGVHAVIEGHTDSVGSDSYNMKLSQRRADAVRNALIDRYGISPSRLTAEGFGKTKPIASNSTPEGRAENRRVVAVMKAETQQTVPATQP